LEPLTVSPLMGHQEKKRGRRHLIETTRFVTLQTREAAEGFIKQDPFILEGVVKSFVIPLE
jgi:hypothetical protein